MTNPNSIHLNFCLNIHLPLRNSKGKKCGTQKGIERWLRKEKKWMKKGVPRFWVLRKPAKCMHDFVWWRWDECPPPCLLVMVKTNINTKGPSSGCAFWVKAKLSGTCPLSFSFSTPLTEFLVQENEGNGQMMTVFWVVGSGPFLETQLTCGIKTINSLF